MLVCDCVCFGYAALRGVVVEHGFVFCRAVILYILGVCAYAGLFLGFSSDVVVCGSKPVWAVWGSLCRELGLICFDLG